MFALRVPTQFGLIDLSILASANSASACGDFMSRAFCSLHSRSSAELKRPGVSDKVDGLRTSECPEQVEDCWSLGMDSPPVKIRLCNRFPMIEDIHSSTEP